MTFADYRTILFELLTELSRGQTYCPLCGAEAAHRFDCKLKDLWNFGLFVEDDSDVE